SIGSCDLFARIGGEEFAIILQSSDKCEAMIVAERMRLNVEKNTSIQNKYNLKETMTRDCNLNCVIAC
ncbi:diguanylate cyclase domain-containing protein, partial [Hafnia paralvei]